MNLASSTFPAEQWLQQQMSLVTENNVGEHYISHLNTYRRIGGEHRLALLQLMKNKFPHKFSGGSR